MKDVTNSVNSEMDSSRRRFFIGAGSALGAVALVSVLPRNALAAAAADLPHLSPTDPTAQALNYIEDAAKADPSKYPGFVAGTTHCATCNFFQGGAAAWGPCQLFPGKDVSATGICSSYSKKA